MTRLLIAIGIAALFVHAATVDRLRLHLSTGSHPVSPLSTVAVQVRCYDAKGDRLRDSGATLKVSDGFVSKPYAWQGIDDEPYPDKSGFTGVLETLTQGFVHKDTFLWTVPEKPGSYRVEAEVAGIRTSTTVEVVASETSLTPAEGVSFPPDPPDERYGTLARHWAPFIAQETWFDYKADIPVRFDYDGDWRGDNNWDNLASGSSQAFVYYTAVETGTHWFLIYNLFHPRDYSDTCAPAMCHENDNEGLVLAVRKDGSRFGRLDAMETLAHNRIYSYVANDRLRRGANTISGTVRFHGGSHPMIFVESGGHGIFAVGPDQPYDPESDQFAGSTGITFVPAGAPGRPAHPNDRRVPYALLSIDQHWWHRRDQPGLFDAPFAYRPFGLRPLARVGGLRGSFLGRKHMPNSARPFWAWYDSRLAKRKILAPGQWALDPAYSMSQTLTIPNDEPWDLEYTHNPYLAEPPAR
ncbi:MAG TPA: hypothetical protein VES20_23375 [Bryobacteraceae bacterium]|nr:hypothetical protein [Bryobacteraceae bacterium]